MSVELLPPPRSPDEEPPLMVGLVERGMQHLRRSTLDFVTRLNRHGRFVRLVLAGAIGLAILVPALKYRESAPGIEVVGAAFAGVFLGLLFAGAGLWLALWARRASAESPEASRAANEAAAELHEALSPTLRELETLRLQTMAEVKRRSRLRLPAGIFIASIAYLVGEWKDGVDMAGLLFSAFIGAVLGEGWAIWKPDRHYRQVYKSRVLPQLAGRRGALTWRPATLDPVKRLRERDILPEYQHSRVDDCITGNPHGLALSITEVRLQRRVRRRRLVVFDGLLVEVTLPRSLTATTVIAPDRGPLGNLSSRGGGGLRRVKLEDSRFEREYQVFGSDDVEARALLTPAFMERFQALSKLSGMAPPGALALGPHFTIALPKRDRFDLFEPPPFWNRTDGAALRRMLREIEGALDIADAVYALDYWAAGRARDARETTKEY